MNNKKSQKERPWLRPTLIIIASILAIAAIVIGVILIAKEDSATNDAYPTDGVEIELPYDSFD